MMNLTEQRCERPCGARKGQAPSALVDLFAPHTAMGNGFARFLAATLITAAVYMAAVIVWRIREGYVVRRFFHTATRGGDTEQQSPREPSVQAKEEQLSVVG